MELWNYASLTCKIKKCLFKGMYHVKISQREWSLGKEFTQGFGLNSGLVFSINIFKQNLSLESWSAWVSVTSKYNYRETVGELNSSDHLQPPWLGMVLVSRWKVITRFFHCKSKSIKLSKCERQFHGGTRYIVVTNGFEVEVQFVDKEILMATIYNYNKDIRHACLFR